MTDTTPDYAGLNLIAEAITEWFGERCPDYAEGCPSCEAWKEYDRLRTLLERNAALERERDEFRSKLSEAIDELMAAEAERIANEVLEALTAGKPEQSGWKLVPKEPSRGRLISMAVRHNHAFLINPDPSATWWSSGVKPEHRESILRNMKQLYEEAIGEGFYSPDKEAGYVTSFEKAQGSASPTPPTAGGGDA
jgi:hypothetical protein